MVVTPFTNTDIFGTVIAGKCSKPGTSKGAAKECYGQINSGFIGDGVFFITAFSGGPPEVVLGVDLKSGEVVFEQVRSATTVQARTDLSCGVAPAVSLCYYLIV